MKQIRQSKNLKVKFGINYMDRLYRGASPECVITLMKMKLSPIADRRVHNFMMIIESIWGQTKTS